MIPGCMRNPSLNVGETASLAKGEGILADIIKISDLVNFNPKGDYQMIPLKKSLEVRELLLLALKVFGWPKNSFEFFITSL